MAGPSVVLVMTGGACSVSIQDFPLEPGVRFEQGNDPAACDRVLDSLAVDVVIAADLAYLAALADRQPDCFRVWCAPAGDGHSNATGAVDAMLLAPIHAQMLGEILRHGRATAQLRRQNRKLVAELSQRNAELERFNHQLEQAVQSRTQHLVAAHQRLQEKQHELVRLETQGAVSELVRGLAHELNNPLAAILGYAQRLQKRLSEDAETVRRLEVITSEVERCRNLVDQLRRLASPLEEPLVPCQPEEALKEAVQRLTEAGMPTPTCTFADRLPPVLAAPHCLVRVFEQLLDNAARAGAKTCFLRGEIVADRTRLILENDGETPDELAIRNAVKPFFTTRASAGRRGLGLTMVASLLREQGGTIALDRRADLPGAHVTIALPRPSPSSYRLAALPGAGESRTVLIVDDEPLVAELLRDCVGSSGCEGLAVSTFGEALAETKRRPLYGIIADVNLPDGNGADLLRRALLLRPELRGHVALVTGEPQEIERLTAENGFPALAKPFRLEEAYELLQRIL